MARRGTSLKRFGLWGSATIVLILMLLEISLVVVGGIYELEARRPTMINGDGSRTVVAYYWRARYGSGYRPRFGIAAQLRGMLVGSREFSLAAEVARDLVAKKLERERRGVYPRTDWRSLRPLFVWATALALLRDWSAEECALYLLHHAPYGHGVVGLRSAAMRYFGKELKQLSQLEAGRLVVVALRGHQRLDPWCFESANRELVFKLLGAGGSDELLRRPARTVCRRPGSE